MEEVRLPQDSSPEVRDPTLLPPGDSGTAGDKINAAACLNLASRADQTSRRKVHRATPVNSVTVMGTNDQATVSKRSVEKLYFQEPHFYNYFVPKPKTRSPLIHRGYWFRMYVIEQTVKKFLAQESNKTKVVVNLGCGYDALPFRLLATESKLCKNAIFADVDHPELLRKKCEMIEAESKLYGLLGSISNENDRSEILLDSTSYKAIGCDLRELATLSKVVHEEFDTRECTFLFVAEVSITYMDTEYANKVVEWAATFSDARFCLLEQFLPNEASHPFAERMLSHFKEQKSELRSIERYPLLVDQELRFINAGWDSAKARSLWDLWSDDDIIDSDKRRALNGIELFDEWEEFALFSSHYFLLKALVSSKTMRVDVSQINSLPPRNPDSKPTFHDPGSKVHNVPSRIHGALYQVQPHVFEHHGGYSGNKRLDTSDLFAIKPGSSVNFQETPKAQPRMCHSVTQLNENFDHLLVGGRNAPNRPLRDCWLRKGGKWDEVQSLPYPLSRHSAVLTSEGVLVYGGISTDRIVMNDWLLWQEGSGWQVLDSSTSCIKPRFAAAITALHGLRNGVLFGGMGDDGTVLSDFHWWRIDSSTRPAQIIIEEGPLRGETATQLCRAGACLTPTPWGHLLIGGIQVHGLPPNNQEIIKIILDETKKLHSVERVLGDGEFPCDTRPLLIGHSAIWDGRDVVVLLGGGGTCFAFNSQLNRNIWKLSENGSFALADWEHVAHPLSH